MLILGPGPLPTLGAAGGAIATVTAQFIVMSIMIRWNRETEERKCIKRYYAHVRNKFLAEYLRRDLQNRNSYCDTGNGILRDIDGNHPHGIWPLVQKPSPHSVWEDRLNPYPGIRQTDSPPR